MSRHQLATRRDRTANACGAALFSRVKGWVGGTESKNASNRGVNIGWKRVEIISQDPLVALPGDVGLLFPKRPAARYKLILYPTDEESQSAGRCHIHKIRGNGKAYLM